MVEKVQNTECKINSPQKNSENEEACKKRWISIRTQFRNELKKIPVTLSQKSELSQQDYGPYTCWPYFKSLLFLKNRKKSRTQAGYYSPAEELNETSNDVKFEDSFSESNECIPDVKEDVARPVRKKSKSNKDCATDILANVQPKLELPKNYTSIEKYQQNDDNEFFDTLIPYMKTMNMQQKMLCRMEILRTLYTYVFPEQSSMQPAAAPNSTIMEFCSEDTKMNIVTIKEEPKDLQN